MLPAEVLEASAKALLDFQGKGFGIAECSHRGKEFDGVLDEAIGRCRKLLDIPESHDVLFLQGGATQLFNTIPMNFLNGAADYVVGGEWSKKAASSAQSAYGEKIRVIASSENDQLRPSAHRLDRGSRRRLPARLLERDRARPPAGRVARAPEPGRRRQLRDDVAAAPDLAHRAGLRGRAEEPGTGRRGADHRAQGSLPAHRQERPQDLQLPGAGRGQELPQHAAHVRRLLPARDLPLAGGQGGLAAIEKRNAEKAALIYDAIDGSGGFSTRGRSPTRPRAAT